MPRLLTALVVLTAIVPSVLAPSAAGAAEIARLANTPPGLILQGVQLPAGTELLMLSGQLASPLDAAKKPADIKGFEDLGDTKTQAISTFAKIKAILASKGYKMSDVVKLTVFLAGDPKLGGRMDFAGFNDGFRLFFGTPENPNTVARSTVQVAALAAPYFLVEIEATAAKTPGR